MNTKVKLITLSMSIMCLTACSSDDSTNDDLTSGDPPMLIWRSCPDNPALECATLKVPMNYADPQSGKIDIAMNRLPAITQPSTGSLLFNPGGPGGSGIEMLNILVSMNTVPESVRRRYDLIGFDPRGVGASTPVDCEEFGIDDFNVYIRNRAEIDEFVQQATHVAERCYEKYGSYLQKLGSMNVVRDMETMRNALKVDRLNFIGYSYGTRLAALYLQTYPEASGAFVLDGSVRPVSTVAPLVEGALPAMQTNLETILAQCVVTRPDCDSGQLLQSLHNRVDTLLATGNEMEFESLGSLLFIGSQAPAFGELLAAPLASYLLEDDTSGLEQLIDTFEPLLAARDEEDSATAQVAVICADDPYRPTAVDLETSLQSYNASSDLFAEAYVSLAGACAGWPSAIEPLAPVATDTAPASLVIGGTSDAQTVIAWSEEMAAAIGGYFLASNHSGHTSVFNEESACVDRIVTDFLLDGLLPSSGDCLLPTEAQHSSWK